MPRFEDEESLKQAAKSFLRDFHQGNPGDFPVTATSIGPSSYELLADLAATIPDDHRPSILDLGCGNGMLCAMVAERLGANCRLYGIDINGAQIDRARQRVSGPHSSFSCTAADQLPLSDGTVDLVLSHMSFHLMSPLEAVLAEIDRVLVAGGRFSFIVGDGENDRGIESDYQAIANRVIEAEGAGDLGQALSDPRLFDLAAFEQLLESHTSFARAFERRRFQLLLKMTAEEYLEFITGDYAWSLVSDQGRATIFRETALMLAAAGPGRLSMPLALQQITLVKQASA